MIGGYQIIDLKGVEIVYDVDMSTTIDTPRAKKQGIYDLIKSLGSKPILIENLNIRFVRSSEGTLESITDEIARFNTPFFTPYTTFDGLNYTILRLYSSFVGQIITDSGSFPVSTSISINVYNDDTVLASI